MPKTGNIPIFLRLCALPDGRLDVPKQEVIIGRALRLAAPQRCVKIVTEVDGARHLTDPEAYR